MTPKQVEIVAVPTNIITGFLGAGKTSAILHLLNSKPSTQRWAVLVNEFGEIGVDGSLFQGQYSQQQGVFVREVPGGCMCCAAGLPMQVALNQLLLQAKPDRLLIEPTGLGHPAEVLQVLSSEHYKKALSLEKILTLVDARKLSDQRYTHHETFIQQIAMADTVIGNKLDLYQNEDKLKLTAYVKKNGQPQAQVLFTTQGEINPGHLIGATTTPLHSSHSHRHAVQESTLLTDVPIPQCGFIKAANQGEGFHSIGWRFAPEKIFNHYKLTVFLSGIAAERMKATFITDEGAYGYNLTSDALTEIELDNCFESRIEIVSPQLDDHIEIQLMECILAR